MLLSRGVDLWHAAVMTDSGETAMTQRWQALPGWALLAGAAVAYWVVGFLPWIIEGLDLTSSSAWPNTYTVEGPRVALPFGEDAFPALFVSSVVGGTAALAVSRLAGPGVHRRRLIAAAGGAIAVLAGLAQTYATVRPAMADTDEARLLVAALVVSVLAFGALGLVVGAGVARGDGWPWLLGGAMAASLFGPWLVDLVDRRPGQVPGWLLQLLQWHPWVSGILLGVVLAVFGWTPATRVLGWGVGLAIAWVVPSVLIAASYATAYFSQGSLTRDHAREVVDAGRDVFVQSLQPDGRTLLPLVLAVAVGAAGVRLRRRS